MNAYAFFWTLTATTMLISTHFTWKNSIKIPNKNVEQLVNMIYFKHNDKQHVSF